MKKQWARIGYGRSKIAHMWRDSETNPYVVLSSCGLNILKEQLRAAVDLPKCKTCEKTESNNV